MRACSPASVAASAAERSIWRSTRARPKSRTMAATTHRAVRLTATRMATAPRSSRVAPRGAGAASLGGARRSHRPAVVRHRLRPAGCCGGRGQRRAGCARLGHPHEHGAGAGRHVSGIVGSRPAAVPESDRSTVPSACDELDADLVVGRGCTGSIEVDLLDPRSGPRSPRGGGCVGRRAVTRALTSCVGERHWSAYTSPAVVVPSRSMTRSGMMQRELDGRGAAFTTAQPAP